MRKSVPIAVNELTEGARCDEVDVLVQAETVQRSLENLGYETFTVPYTENSEDLEKQFGGPDVTAVFNLVEAVRGENALQYVAPLSFEMMGTPFTGNPSEALKKTTDKMLAKEMMKLADIPTPPYLSAQRNNNTGKIARFRDRKPMIFKPVHEDASVGIREDLIGPYTMKEALDVLALLEGETGMTYMAEEYIEGREFNISLIESAGVPAILPLVEQDFSLLPSSSPRIVGYRAKWVEDSDEYASIPRNYAFQSVDRPLIEKARRLAVGCWDLFKLSGYARVDIRVSEKGHVFVLEVNANPCLSPEAGFAFAAGLAGLRMDDVVKLILDAAADRAASRKIHRAG
jgi:D-alanine-D-alanine ligase